MSELFPHLGSCVVIAVEELGRGTPQRCLMDRSPFWAHPTITGLVLHLIHARFVGFHFSRGAGGIRRKTTSYRPRPVLGGVSIVALHLHQRHTEVQQSLLG